MSHPVTLQELISIKEAAEIAGVRPRTIYSWAYEYGLRYFLVGNRIRVSRVDLAAFMLTHQPTPAAADCAA